MERKVEALGPQWSGASWIIITCPRSLIVSTMPATQLVIRALVIVVVGHSSPKTRDAACQKTPRRARLLLLTY